MGYSDDEGRDYFKYIIMILVVVNIILSAYMFVLVSDNSTAIGITQTQFNVLSNNITTLNAQLTTTKNLVTSLSATVTSLGTNIETLTTSLNSLSTRVASLEAQISTLSSSVTMLGGQVSGFQAQLITAQAQLVNMTAQIAQLQDQVYVAKIPEIVRQNLGVPAALVNGTAERFITNINNTVYGLNQTVDATILTSFTPAVINVTMPKITYGIILYYNATNISPGMYNATMSITIPVSTDEVPGLSSMLNATYSYDVKTFFSTIVDVVNGTIYNITVIA